jgi:hypothetical protein
MNDIIEAAFENRADLNPQSASTEIKQAVAEAIQHTLSQHEPHQNKAKDCLTRTPPKQNKRLPNTNPTKTKQKRK